MLTIIVIFSALLLNSFKVWGGLWVFFWFIRKEGTIIFPIINLYMWVCWYMIIFTLFSIH
ncbi:MAG: hypothetical protein Q7S33_02345 [Nanoarchaeota archaeon]|nr:hypothetical protein [Nanoarchaeota archaeon]